LNVSKQHIPSQIVEQLRLAESLNQMAGSTPDHEALQAKIKALEQENAQLKQGSPRSSVYDTYQTPLTGRYCSPEMQKLFSQRSRHSTWRKLWLYLAESEKELGIDTITPEALEQMRNHLEVTDEDFEVARVEEKRRRHDVMAHVHAFAAVCPAAAGIIHYGVRSLSLNDQSAIH
jgi:adenylosuccinate lyase